MQGTSDRLRRLLASQLEGCRDVDVDRRLEELDDLADAASTADLAADRQAFSTLGDETRYRLARLLATADEELCVCELAPLVDVSDSAVSHALSDLTAAGLAVRRKNGKWRFYRSTERAERLLAAVDGTQRR